MKYTLNICWLYPDLMSTYGDRGNVMVLQKRCEWRGINVTIENHTIGSSYTQIEKADLLFMGGAQDRQQDIVSKDMKGKKAEVLKNKIQDNTPGLYICGAYQFLGRYYKPADGTKIPGLGIFDIYTIHPGEQKKRLVGNIVVHLTKDTILFNDLNHQTIVGFENHGGRTYLGNTAIPFARVIKGHGNNGEDGMEGVVYKNSIGSYLHGPLLPKNPELADWLIQKALEKKYKKSVILSSLNDAIENKARDVITDRLGV